MYLMIEYLRPILMSRYLFGGAEEIHKTRKASFRSRLSSEMIMFPVAGSVSLGSDAAAKAIEEIMKVMQFQESGVVMDETMQQVMM
jgi:hypothetical protein